jgi:hypothetical protein
MLLSHHHQKNRISLLFFLCFLFFSFPVLPIAGFIRRKNQKALYAFPGKPMLEIAAEDRAHAK